jgi:hypothetical protein
MDKTRESVEVTSWARLFKEECPSGYEKAIEHALNPDLQVDIDFNNENGSWVYAVRVVGDEEFWMDAFPSRRKAVQFCAAMGWPVKERSAIK